MPTPEDRFFNLIHAKLTLQEPEDLVASVRNLRRGDNDPLNLGRKRSLPKILRHHENDIRREREGLDSLPQSCSA